MTRPSRTPSATKPARRMARMPQASDPAEEGSTSDAGAPAPAPLIPPAPLPPATKAAHVLTLLRRPDGATLAELVAATGWLPHTTRAHLTGLKKKGHPLISTKVDAVRRYRLPQGNA